MDSATDEDTNGSFEFVDKVTDSSESDEKHFEVIHDKKDTSSESSEKSHDFDDNNYNRSSEITVSELQKKDSDVPEYDDTEKKEADENNSENAEWLDILGSGNILKKVLKEGPEKNRPERLDICEIRYECKIDDKVVEKEERKEIQAGDTELIQGLDLTIPLMNIGEVSLIKVGPRFGYGSIGCLPNIPPNATLLYEVELLSATPEPEIETMSVEIRSETGKRKKDRGNWWYSRGEYTFAIHCYKRALEYLDYTNADDVENKQERVEADGLIEDRMKVYNNLGAVQMKIGELESALQSVNTVLDLDPDNVKAIYRKGKILAEKNELADALECFGKALELDPENSSIKNESSKCQMLLNKQTSQERALYKRMFNKPIGSDKPPSSESHIDYFIKIALAIGGLIALSIGIYYAGYRFTQ